MKREVFPWYFVVLMWLKKVKSQNVQFKNGIKKGQVKYRCPPLQRTSDLLFTLFTFMKFIRRREDTELQELPFSADQLTQWFIWLLLITRYTEKSREISIFQTSWLLFPLICLSTDLASNVTLKESEESTVFWSFLKGFSCVTLSRLSTGGVRSACCFLKPPSYNLSDLQKFLTGYVTAKGYSLSRLGVYLSSLEE